METIKTYKGYKDGVYGIYCGTKPDGLEVEEEITVYRPDKDKVFSKDDKTFTSVILKKGEKISDYTEVDAPKREVNPLKRKKNDK